MQTSHERIKWLPSHPMLMLMNQGNQKREPELVLTGNYYWCFIHIIAFSGGITFIQPLCHLCAITRQFCAIQLKWTLSHISAWVYLRAECKLIVRKIQIAVSCHGELQESSAMTPTNAYSR